VFTRGECTPGYRQTRDGRAPIDREAGFTLSLFRKILLGSNKQTTITGCPRQRALELGRVPSA